jgi:hypothetical protein
VKCYFRVSTVLLSRIPTKSLCGSIRFSIGSLRPAGCGATRPHLHQKQRAMCRASFSVGITSVTAMASDFTLCERSFRVLGPKTLRLSSMMRANKDDAASIASHGFCIHPWKLWEGILGSLPTPFCSYNPFRRRVQAPRWQVVVEGPRHSGAVPRKRMPRYLFGKPLRGMSVASASYTCSCGVTLAAAVLPNACS